MILPIVTTEKFIIATTGYRIEVSNNSVFIIFPDGTSAIPTNKLEILEMFQNMGEIVTRAKNIFQGEQ